MNSNSNNIDTLFSVKSNMVRDIIIYDGNCGICNYIVEWIRENDKSGKLDYLPNQMLESEISLKGIKKEDASRSVILYCPNEMILYKEARAVFEILKRLKGMWHFIGAVHSNPVSSTIALPIYRFVSTNRANISKILGLQACKFDLN